MNLMWFIALVIFISLSGVLMPGPIFANAIYEGRKDKYAGIKIATGHAIVEVPIIVTLFFIGKFEFPAMLKSLISIVGGIFLLYLAFTFFKNRERKIFKGIVAGILLSSLNPYFILWWLTVGFTLAIKATYFGLMGLLSLIIFHESCDFSWYGFITWLSNKGARFQKVEKVAALLSFSLLIFFGIFFIYSGAVIYK